MATFVRKTVETSAENQITTAMVVSTTFIKKIKASYKAEFFVNSFARIICDWCMDYFDKYEEAPNTDIQNLFEVKKFELDKADAEIIEKFLIKLSKDYADSGGLKNVDHAVDVAIKHFRERKAQLFAMRLKGLSDLGEIDRIEEEIAAYHKINKIEPTWKNPLTPDSIINTFLEDETARLFKMPGALGDLLGYFEREWLVGLLGVFKRGKCVKWDSVISLPNGEQKSAEDCFEQKIPCMLSLNEETGKIVESRVKEHIANGVKPCYRVMTRTGRTSEVTIVHPYLTINGWKPLEELSVGDYIAVPRELPFGIDSEDKNYIKLLGYFIADGHLKNLTFTKFNSSKNGKLIREDFKNCVINIGDRLSEFDEGIHLLGGDGSNFRGFLLNKQVKLNLSKNKELPSFIFSLNKECLRSLLQTMFTCDGSVFIYKRKPIVEYYSSSEVLINQVQTLLSKFGVVSKLRSGFSKLNGKKFKAFEITIQDFQSVSKFCKEIGFLFEKQDKLEKGIEEVINKTESRGFLDVVPPDMTDKIISYCKDSKIPLKEYRSTLHQSKKKNGALSRKLSEEMAERFKMDSLKQLLQSNILWDRVESIEYIEDHEVYDFALEGSHNFIANNVYVHNTFGLQEIIVQSLTHRLKVFYVSLEGASRNLNMRVFRRISGLGTEHGEMIRYPVFDCTLNQIGSCNLPERKNTHRLKDTEEAPLPEFDKNNPYRVCTACRGDGSNRYSVSTWFEMLSPDSLSISNVMRKMHEFQYMYGKNNLRTKNYPRFGASVTDINRDLDMLEMLEGFVPDVIVVDYADILRPDKIAADRFGIDEIWKLLAAMSAERHALVVTASQGNRGSLHKSSVEDSDLAEWIGKLGHVDLFAALHQSKGEKKLGIIRWGILAHRHKEFDPDRHAMVLQNLNVGQQNLDSEITYVSNQ